MKLDYLNVSTHEGRSAINLQFLTDGPPTPELLAEIGQRIENFLMPLHTSAPVPVAEPIDNLETIEAAPAPIAEIAPPIRRNRGKMPPPVEAPPMSRSFLQSPEVAKMADRALAHSRAAILDTAEAPPAPTPRRTRAPAPAVAPEITDMDLAKAASAAAEVLGTQIVKDIIAEMGVKTVNEIEGFEKRQYFLGLLDAEKELVAEEKANG